MKFHRLFISTYEVEIGHDKSFMLKSIFFVISSAPSKMARTIIQIPIFIFISSLLSFYFLKTQHLNPHYSYPHHCEPLLHSCHCEPAEGGRSNPICSCDEPNDEVIPEMTDNKWDCFGSLREPRNDKEEKNSQ